MREKERDMPRARSQAAASQTWRQQKSMIYRKKERYKVPRQTADEENQVKL